MVTKLSQGFENRCEDYTVVLWKNTHGGSTLQDCQSGGWALFEVFPLLTTKSAHVLFYSGLMPWSKITGRTIAYKKAANSFKVWWYTTLWIQWQHVTRACCTFLAECDTLATSVYAKRMCKSLQWSKLRYLIALDTVFHCAKLHECALWVMWSSLQGWCSLRWRQFSFSFYNSEAR